MGIGAGAGAAIAGVATLASGALTSSASTSAASTQSAASKYAAKLQYAMYQQTAARLSPWVTTGQAANTSIGNLLSSGTGVLGTNIQGFSPTQSQLSQTPGYQFTLNQGLQATQNAAASMGLGKSGSALQGAANYASGLASTTYQQQFQNYWTQLQNVYNMLYGTSSTGAQAATQTGQFGTSTASSAGNYLTSGAAASAAGTVGSASALSNTSSSLGSLGLTYGLLSSQGQYQATNISNQSTGLQPYVGSTVTG